MVISGASAGGYTALRALALSDVFVAATCISGIVDLIEFRRRTHKFQQYELDRLVGKLPDRLADYESRSLLASADRIDRPVLLAHSVRDVVAPSEAVVAFAQALYAQGTPHELLLLQQDGHPPSGSESRAALLEAEVGFYRAVFDDNASCKHQS
jgi:dipeptidyl aminopeptidase/acylaminoacyl peptidase